MKEEIKTKICHECGVEKPVEEFNKAGKDKKGEQLFNSKCKVCEYFIRNNPKILEKWTLEEYKIIIDNIYNKNVYLNDILPLLHNKDLKDLCFLLKNVLLTKNKPLKILYRCDCCGKESSQDMSNYLLYNKHYCGNECTHMDERNRISYKCDYCGKECERPLSSYNKVTNHFCSHECADKFNGIRQREQITLICKQCKKEYEVPKHRNGISNFCCKKCYNDWLLSNTPKGKDNCMFTSKKIKCDWCGIEYYEKPSKINSRENHFCSNKCRYDWLEKDYSQRNSVKERARIRAVNMLSNGVFNHTNTNIQKIINNLLKELNIEYINEYNCKYVAIDNYLPKHNLMIECMGTYWHTDNRKYKTINYKMQRNRIIKDKGKHTYIKNNYNIEILYLWEEDIINNLNLCKQLILEYIGNKGILKNYHSFNYCLDKNNKIKSHDEIILPYMEWDSKKLSKIVDLRLKEKISQKQQDKWITFKCEYCGKEREELICHYNKNKHHYCSRECCQEAKKSKKDIA